MKIIKGFLGLNFYEKRKILTLFFYLIQAEGMISFMPYSVSRPYIFKENSVYKSSQESSEKILKLYLKLLKILCNKLPWNITCLRKAVALRNILAKEGVAATLRIGMSKIDNMGNTKLNAHAWLESCGYEILKNGTYNLLEYPKSSLNQRLFNI